MTRYILLLLFILSLSTICLTQTPKPTPDPEKYKNDPEYRQKWKEFEEKYAEVTAANKKIEELNKKVNAFLVAGVAAFNAKNYTLAVEKFDDAIKADDFWPAHLTLLSNKSGALQALGVEIYNNGVRTKSPTAAEAIKYLKQAIECLDQAFLITVIHKDETDPSWQQLISENRVKLIRARSTAWRIYGTMDPSQIPAAIIAIESYIAIETDKDLKAAALKDLETLRSKAVRLGGLDPNYKN